jgi:Na+:H+ antiporter, NhaA family
MNFIVVHSTSTAASTWCSFLWVNNVPQQRRGPIRRVTRVLMSPVERFLRVEASAGILLLLASALALLLANTGKADADAHLRNVEHFGAASRAWVNEGLMTLFFLVVGLELRRELADGELSTLRRAMTPLVAALGGMLAPALVYVALNSSGAAAHGWGVPTATDIAFAVGVLSLLGKRVSPAMRILLLALAVVDDLGAVLVITLGYAGTLSVAGIPYVIASVLVLALVRVRTLVIVPLALAWYGLYRCGVHPSLSGVAVGLCVRIAKQGAETESPTHMLLRVVHPWTSFVIMPMFAFVNAGIVFGAAGSPRVVLGTALGLLLGKPLGIFGATWTGARMGLIVLPRGLDAKALLVVAMTAGIGFTMSLFIAEAAFPEGGNLHGSAKVGVLVGSALSACLALALGRLLLRPEQAQGAAVTAQEAEQSTEM